MIKVLMISNDPKILQEGSNARARMLEYGTLFEELHIIVFSKDGKRENISPNVYLYPTSSLTKLLYMRDAYKIACSVVEDHGLTQGNSVVTAQDVFEARVAKKISGRFGVPFHSQLHTDMYSPYFPHTLKNKMRLRLAPKIFKDAKAIRVVSERIKDSMSEEFQARTRVLPIFADLEAIRNSPVAESLREKYPQFKKIILMASRLTKEKDIPTAIEAFSEASKDHPDIGLVIVGSGPQGEKIEKSDSIVLLPWVSQGTLISYMKSCDVFLSASLYEGYGLSMLEAHACGATLAATDAGIASLLAGEVAEPKDASGLARVLSKALSGELKNKHYDYPYPSKAAYLEAYKEDLVRATH